MEFYGQRRIEVLGEKRVPVPLCPLQMPDVLEGWEKDNAKELFCPNAPGYPMFDGSQASVACPADNSSIKMKMSVEHWWKDTDRVPKYWEKKKYVPVPLCPPQIHVD